MALTIPNYLKAANVQDTSLRYEWDDWYDPPVLEATDEDLVARLQRVSQRAVLAFATGTAEWIVYRFGRLSNDPAPWDFLEAAWAMVVHVRYCGWGSATGWQEYSVKGWDGPVRRPIKNALKLLEIAFQELAREFHTDPTLVTATISTLACYVMTDPAPYREWSGRVLDRFESLYPRHPEDPLGDVVPRQAVDPDFDFRVEQTEVLVNRFLAGLDYRSNRFLTPPEGLLEHFEEEEDFVGTPYVFDMELDRRTRPRVRGRGHSHE
jgi:hypothetical protein